MDSGKDDPDEPPFRFDAIRRLPSAEPVLQQDFRGQRDGLGRVVLAET